MLGDVQIKFLPSAGAAKCLMFIVLFLVNTVGSCTASLADGSSLFDFSTDFQGWKTWGEGEGEHNSSLGHAQNGSVQLSCNTGQEQTLHKKFKLAPGQYEVSAWIRAFNVQKGQWNYAIWLFYQADEKIVSPVKDLHGTFEWSRVRYTIQVKDKPVNIWFRLKSQGTIWIDDIQVKPSQGKPVSFLFDQSSREFPKSNSPGTGIRCPNCYHWTGPERTSCAICGASFSH